jgi:7,8-dihydropterin-6-yl-methyl-4-(beta-D-ribofuranosyl)aminobenzene 5'-phosphate synthase
MKITALVENTRLEGREDLRPEHGLSLHVSLRNGRQILFDTGASEAFAQNAEKLGVDIRKVDWVVISHHHYDHGGGLPLFLKANPKAPVYLRRCEERDYYFSASGHTQRPIGLERSLFQQFADRFVFVDGFTEISPGIFLLTEIAKPHPLPKGNRYLFAEKGGRLELDDFDHELMMVIREEDGLVVFTGCSHSGILNMIETAARRFERERIKVLLGGFHLMGLPKQNTMAGSKEEVEDLGREIMKHTIDKLYTGHCTGMKAYGVLKGVLGEKLELFPTGCSIEV